MTGPLDVPQLDLRQRRSAKWSTLPAETLALGVAEMDVALSPDVAGALQTAMSRSDTGYAGDPAPLREAFAGFAERAWAWQVPVQGIAACADVATAATEVLRTALSPGDGVIVMPPVYPRFSAWVAAAGARTIEVPLVDLHLGGRLDLPGIRMALAAGSKAILLCHPHNPLGRIHEPAELSALADLALEYEALVLSDEIHAPLTLPPHTFVPFLQVSAAAQHTGVALTGASKAWNVPGLKCALVVAQSGRPREILDRVSDNFAWGVGHLGAIAAQAAFTEDSAWLAGLRIALAANVVVLRDAVREQLPEVVVTEPQASYLAWLDFRALGLGPDPAAAMLARARVALSPGLLYGPSGAGFARLNLACSPEVLREAVRRMADAVS